jgi:hypothetical protein
VIAGLCDMHYSIWRATLALERSRPRRRQTSGLPAYLALR